MHFSLSTNSAGNHKTLCQHGIGDKVFGARYYFHSWTPTSEKVTCKRCLKLLEPPNKKTKIVACVSGGVLVAVHTNIPNIEIEVFDFDNLAEFPGEEKEKEKEYDEMISKLKQIY